MSKPRRIGSYEIIQEIGRGRFAAVYKARDPALEQVVALKVLHTAYTGRSDVVQRFLGKARKVVKLKHRGIVRVYTVDMAGNVWEWTASDYGEGTKVVRGGAFYYVAQFVRCALRFRDPPLSRSGDFGFRLVASPVS